MYLIDSTCFTAVWSPKMADWGPGNNTTGPADQWGNGGGSNDFGTNDFGTNDNFGGTNFDDDQFGGGAADGFDNGFGGGSGAVDGGRANGGGDRTCYNCGQEGFVPSYVAIDDKAN